MAECFLSSPAYVRSAVSCVLCVRSAAALSPAERALVAGGAGDGEEVGSDASIAGDSRTLRVGFIEHRQCDGQDIVNRDQLQAFDSHGTLFLTIDIAG